MLTIFIKLAFKVVKSVQEAALTTYKILLSLEVFERYLRQNSVIILGEICHCYNGKICLGRNQIILLIKVFFMIFIRHFLIFISFIESFILFRRQIFFAGIIFVRC